jgi:hypothetical protein
MNPNTTRPHGRRLRLAPAALAAAALAACGGGEDPPPRAVAAAHAVAPAAAAPAPAPASAPAAPAWHLAAQPADARVAPGEAASFHVRAEGAGGAFEYQWLRDGEPIEGAAAAQYGFVTTLDDGGATFSVLVRPRGAGAGHERESAPATLGWRDDGE